MIIWIVINYVISLLANLLEFVSIGILLGSFEADIAQMFDVLPNLALVHPQAKTYLVHYIL